MSNETLEQFIGPRRVLGLVKTDHKTHAGAEVVEVAYEGEANELLSLKAFESLVTDKPTDWTNLRNRKIAFLTLKVLETLAEYDLKAEEVPALKTSVENELYNNLNRAVHYLWTKDKREFIPGIDLQDDRRSLLEADIIIKGIKNESAKDGQTEASPKS